MSMDGWTPRPAGPATGAFSRGFDNGIERSVSAQGRTQGGVDLSAAPTPATDLAGNDAVQRRQRMALYAGGAVVVVLCGWWLFADSGTKPTGPETPKGGQQISVSTDDLGARNLSEKEWIAMSENRLQAQDNQLRRMAGRATSLQQLQTQLDALRSENSNMAADGTKVVSAYEDENRNLRQQLAAAQSGAAAAAGPRALYGAGGPSSYQGFGASGVPGGSPLAAARARTQGHQLHRLAIGRHRHRQTRRSRQHDLYRQPQLPAGEQLRQGARHRRRRCRVQCAIAVRSPAGGPAHHRPGALGRAERQGADHADRRLPRQWRGARRSVLEKVYVRLAKMTCPQPGGRFAESEVKGFVAFGGKTGVRGRVVSREGSLTMQAFFAGLVGGVGKGFSVNTRAYLTGAQTVVNGERPKLSAGDIAQGAWRGHRAGR
jgi:conjugal transfer pilus assembly protein TraB